MTDVKNTLTNTQSTKPVVNRVPPKNPMFNQFKKPNTTAETVMSPTWFWLKSNGTVITNTPTIV